MKSLADITLHYIKISLNIDLNIYADKNFKKTII